MKVNHGKGEISMMNVHLLQDLNLSTQQAKVLLESEAYKQLHLGICFFETMLAEIEEDEDLLHVFNAFYDIVDKAYCYIYEPFVELEDSIIYAGLKQDVDRKSQEQYDEEKEAIEKYVFRVIENMKECKRDKDNIIKKINMLFMSI